MPSKNDFAVHPAGTVAYLDIEANGRKNSE